MRYRIEANLRLLARAFVFLRRRGVLLADRAASLLVARARARSPGNATEVVIGLFGALVLFCVLSGRWWVLLYVLGILTIFGFVLLYAVYLEYNAQSELDRRARAQRTAQRFSKRI